jgi:hypothetical protein
MVREQAVAVIVRLSVSEMLASPRKKPATQSWPRSLADGIRNIRRVVWRGIIVVRACSREYAASIPVHQFLRQNQ